MRHYYIFNKKNKPSLIGFISFVYHNYIIEEWNVFSKFGTIFIYPLWFFRSLAIWIIGPLFLPKYLFLQSNLYKKIKGIFKYTEFKVQ